VSWHDVQIAVAEEYAVGSALGCEPARDCVCRLDEQKLAVVICHGDARITLLSAQLHEQRDHEPLIIQALADVHASPDVCLGRASLRGRPA
jgi:hypothetical protein